eukprot:7388842-Prymnesium_polylepis.2
MRLLVRRVPLRSPRSLRAAQAAHGGRRVAAGGGGGARLVARALRACAGHRLGGGELQLRGRRLRPRLGEPHLEAPRAAVPEDILQVLGDQRLHVQVVGAEDGLQLA